jgi:hypothetical protein
LVSLMVRACQSEWHGQATARAPPAPASSLKPAAEEASFPRVHTGRNERPRLVGKFIEVLWASFVMVCARLRGLSLGPQTPGP